MCICIVLDFVSILSRHPCAIFNNRITSVVDDYVQQ